MRNEERKDWLLEGLRNDLFGINVDIENGEFLGLTHSDFDGIAEFGRRDSYIQIDSNFNWNRIMIPDDQYMFNSPIVCLTHEVGVAIHLVTGEKIDLQSKLRSKYDSADNTCKSGDVVRIEKGFFNGRKVILCSDSIKLFNHNSNIGIIESTYNNSYCVRIGECLYIVNKDTVSKVDMFENEEIENLFNSIAKGESNVELSEDMLHISIVEENEELFIQYIPKKRLERFRESSIWDTELRAKFAQKRKIRRYFKAIFPDVKPSKVENKLGMIARNLKFELISGEKIREVFAGSNIEQKGNLGRSCMIDKSPTYFDIYVDNAKALVLYNGQGKIIARCIVWELNHVDNNKDGIILADRIYISDDSFAPSVINYIEKNGWYRLPDQTYGESDGMNDLMDMEVDLRDYYVETKKPSYSRYPYMDTMQYFANKRLTCRASMKRLRSTSGNYDEVI